MPEILTSGAKSLAVQVKASPLELHQALAAKGPVALPDLRAAPGAGSAGSPRRELEHHRGSLTPGVEGRP